MYKMFRNIIQIRNIPQRFKIINSYSTGFVPSGFVPSGFVPSGIQISSLEYLVDDSFQTSYKCCCFDDKRKIEECLCMSDFYSDKFKNEYKLSQ